MGSNSSKESASAPAAAAAAAAASSPAGTGGTSSANVVGPAGSSKRGTSARRGGSQQLVDETAASVAASSSSSSSSSPAASSDSSTATSSSKGRRGKDDKSKPPENPNKAFLFAAQSGNVDELRRLVKEGGVDVNVAEGSIVETDDKKKKNEEEENDDDKDDEKEEEKEERKKKEKQDKLKANVFFIAGDTALHYAAQMGHVKVIEFLWGVDANLEAKNKFGSTPLHRAVANKQEAAVKLLLEKGAKIDEHNKFQNNVLHIAAFSGHNELLDYLLSQKNALHMLQVTNKAGLKPEHYARKGTTLSVILKYKTVDAAAARVPSFNKQSTLSVPHPAASSVGVSQVHVELPPGGAAAATAADLARLRAESETHVRFHDDDAGRHLSTIVDGDEEKGDVAAVNVGAGAGTDADAPTIAGAGATSKELEEATANAHRAASRSYSRNSSANRRAQNSSAAFYGSFTRRVR